jgi:hypothetical protein
MKRWGVVLGLLLFPLVLLARLLLAPVTLPAEADLALERYLALQNRKTGAGLAFLAAGRASRPQTLRSWWSARVVGDSARYRIDQNFAGTPLMPPLPARPGEITSAPGGIPLPYPPVEVWCVTFQANAYPADPPQPVLLVLHEDLYNGAWLVHELAERGLDRLDRLGCPDNLEGWPSD